MWFFPLLLVLCRLPPMASIALHHPRRLPSPSTRWFFPLLLVLCLLLFSAATRLLSRSLERGTDVASEAFTVKLFVGALAFAGAGMYVAASIAGAGMGLNDIVVVSMVGLLAVACLLVGQTLGWQVCDLPPISHHPLCACT